MNGYWPEKLICLLRGHRWRYLPNEAHKRLCSRCWQKEYAENAWASYPRLEGRS